MDKELYSDAIAEVAACFGGLENLAPVLNVRVEDLRRWAEGRGRPPTDVFLELADLKDQLERGPQVSKRAFG